MKITSLAAIVAFGLAGAAHSADLSLAYFMGPKHPLNAGIFTPFAEQIAAETGGALQVQQFPGGALNSVPPKQYSILLDGVADVVMAIPGYTADAFPKTSVMGLPGVCDTAVSCTQALDRARPELEAEYDAKVLAIWANAPPVLVTRDKPVRTLDDLEGLKIRVTSKGDVAFVEALGASAITQPVTVINQNLANGVIDAIMIDPSAIRSFSLYEPGNYVTTWFPGSGSAFVMLMNKDVYAALPDADRAAIDKVAGLGLSLGAGQTYDAVATGGMKAARDNGMELIDWAPGEREKVEAVIEEAMVGLSAQAAGDSTVGDMISLMKGE